MSDADERAAVRERVVAAAGQHPDGALQGLVEALVSQLGPGAIAWIRTRDEELSFTVEAPSD